MVVFALASRLEILFITSFGEESHVVEDVYVSVEFRENVCEGVEAGVEISVDVSFLHRTLEGASATKLVANFLKDEIFFGVDCARLEERIR